MEKSYSHTLGNIVEFTSQHLGQKRGVEAAITIYNIFQWLPHIDRKVLKSLPTTFLVGLGLVLTSAQANAQQARNASFDGPITPITTELPQTPTPIRTATPTTEAPKTSTPIAIRLATTVPSAEPSATPTPEMTKIATPLFSAEPSITPLPAPTKIASLSSSAELPATRVPIVTEAPTPLPLTAPLEIASALAMPELKIDPRISPYAERALLRLQKCSPSGFALVQKYVQSIKMGNDDASHPDLDNHGVIISPYMANPFYLPSDDSRQIFLGIDFVHEARHLYQFYDNRPIWNDESGPGDSERDAYRTELSALDDCLPTAKNPEELAPIREEIENRIIDPPNPNNTIPPNNTFYVAMANPDSSSPSFLIIPISSANGL